ncbi:MAG: class I SAM-dependent methyltransferase [Acidiferrobacterales bacterium]
MPSDIRDCCAKEPEQRRFSHVPNVTGYMVKVVGVVKSHFGNRLRGVRVLDMPAGNGWVTTTLRDLGADVTPADINCERPDYVYADMESPLPFESESFDCVLCMEGIEHVLSPTALYRELARVLRPNGLLVISTPNIQNFFSRMQFASVGYFYQFHPSAAMQRPPPGRWRTY